MYHAVLISTISLCRLHDPCAHEDNPRSAIAVCIGCFCLQDVTLRSWHLLRASIFNVACLRNRLIMSASNTTPPSDIKFMFRISQNFCVKVSTASAESNFPTFVISDVTAVNYSLPWQRRYFPLPSKCGNGLIVMSTRTQY